MKPGISDRRERWRFTSILGTCGMFLKGISHLDKNKFATPEIIAQAHRAFDEVAALSYLIKDRFK